jgi:uracil-DNA glycosylase family 4
MSGFFESSTVQKERPSGLIPRCGSCGLFKGCQSPKMPVYGKGRKGILFVGEAPGQTEDEKGRPFIGKAGQFLREALEALDFDLDKDAWTTNSLICRPPGNKTPEDKQIEYCRPNLLNTIEQLKPTVVVLLGRSAVCSALPVYWKGEVGELSRWVGWQIPGPDNWICPTYHPSYLGRVNSPLLNRMFSQHLEEAISIEITPPEPHDFRPQIKLLYDADDVLTAIEEIDSEGGWVAVDYETNCLKPEYPKARIYSCALSNGHRTVSFPWCSVVAEGMTEFFRSDRTKKIASNLKFEDRWTRKMLGTRVRNWGWDTMLAAHCLDNRRGICSLKFQSWVKLGVPTYNEHIAPYLSSGKGHYNSIEKIELDDLLFYGGMDGLLEYRLAMVQMKEIGI